MRLGFRSGAFGLAIGDDGALLLAPSTGRGAAPIRFARHEDSDACAMLVRTLQSRPRAPVLILEDSMSQEYRSDTLPNLRAADRRNLLKRRLRHYFPEAETPVYPGLACAFTLNKARDNAQALYVCLHREGPLALWLDNLKPCGNSLRGIAPLPLVGARLLGELEPSAMTDWHLLLSWQRTGGFRQIVVKDGAFIFTRMTPSLPVGSSPEYLVASLALDLQATLDYLRRLGLNEASPLRVTCLLPSSLHLAVQALPSSVSVQTTLTCRQACLRLGLDDSSADDTAGGDSVFAAWALRQRRLPALMRPRDSVAPDGSGESGKSGKSETAYRLKKAGTNAALTSGVIALIAVGWMASDLWQQAQAYRQATVALTLAQNEWQRESAALAPITEPLGKLRQALARQRLFSTPTPSPWNVLGKLAQVLQSKGRLTRLAWRNGASIDRKSQEDLEAEQTGQPSPESLQCTVRLYLAQPLADEQDGVRRVDGLARDMQDALPGWTVTVTRYPFLVKADATLSNAAATPQTADGSPSADFTLVRKETDS